MSKLVHWNVRRWNAWLAVKNATIPTTLTGEELFYRAVQLSQPLFVLTNKSCVQDLDSDRCPGNNGFRNTLILDKDGKVVEGVAIFIVTERGGRNCEELYLDYGPGFSLGGKPRIQEFMRGLTRKDRRKTRAVGKTQS